jgi:hypothetical protein
VRTPRRRSPEGRGHRFHRVHAKVHDRLLELDAVGVERRQAGRKCGVDYHAAPPGIALQEGQHLGHHGVDIHRLALRLARGDQRSHATDDLARAQVRAPDVGEDRAQLLACRGVAPQEGLGGAIREDRAERLVDLVRDRAVSSPASAGAKPARLGRRCAPRLPP